MPRDVQLFSVTEKHNKNLWKLLLGQLFICAAPSVFISMGANTPDAPKVGAVDPRHTRSELATGQPFLDIHGTPL